MRNTTKKLLCALLLSGCAEDLGAALSDEDSGGEDEGGGSKVDNTDEGTMVRTVVDATDATTWIWFDFQSRSQVEVADPLHSDAWDLGFSRFDIAINGGVSGEGGMEAIVLENTELADVGSVPSGTWIADALDGDDEGDDLDYALAGWYDYDFMTHVLSARPTVYVVRSVEGDAFALEVVDYYDDAGSSGWMQVRWKPIDD